MLASAGPARPIEIEGARYTLAEPPEPLRDMRFGATTGESATRGQKWLTLESDGRGEALLPWEWAHAAAENESLAHAITADEIEPDYPHDYVMELEQADGDCDEAIKNEKSDNGFPDGPEFAWHLGPKFSQLADARDSVGQPQSGQSRIRIVHLDTGYLNHIARPPHLNTQLGRNFVSNENFMDASDITGDGLGKSPGHGLGTMGILAGGLVDENAASFIGTFNGYLGGAPHAEVVPVRISEYVFHFYTSQMSDGIDYARSIGADVVSISAGGVASSRWADAVNDAYEAGVAIFAAAGNNFGGLPTRNLVYPGRFHRSVAVCGATSEGKRYGLNCSKKMQGNYGPESVMHTAMSAYSPHIPWLHKGCQRHILRHAGGTSSSTPQVAAAAALWLQKYGSQLPRDWRRVEAVRHALFNSAAEGNPHRFKHFGKGILRANDALSIAPLQNLDEYVQQPDDKCQFPFLRVILGRSEPNAPLELETLQIIEQDAELGKLVADPHMEEEAKVLRKQNKKKFAEAIISSRYASKQLKRAVRNNYQSL